MIWLLQQTGRQMLFILEESGRAVLLFLQTIKSCFYLFTHGHLLADQMMKIGVKSIPLVGVVSVFTGAVSAWQAAYQFEGIVTRRMAMDFLGAAVSAAIFIELAPVLTGLVIAGRVGASLAAEIGSMKVTEQVDALESLAIDPVKYLALPRFLAGLIMMPVLVIYAGLLAHIGAYVVAHYLLDLPAALFFGSVQEHFLAHNVFSGLIKALFFGGGTALIGCSIGLRTEGGAEGVGSSTIRAFVYSSAFILIFDYILAMVLF